MPVMWKVIVEMLVQTGDRGDDGDVEGDIAGWKICCQLVLM